MSLHMEFFFLKASLMMKSIVMYFFWYCGEQKVKRVLPLSINYVPIFEKCFTRSRILMWSTFKFFYQWSVLCCRSLIFSSYLILCPTKLNFFQVSCSNSITIISLIEYNLDKRPKTWNKLVRKLAKNENTV